MEETLDNIRELKRHLNSIEHMIYVSCKFTRTTEMLRKVIETIITGYEIFFGVAYNIFTTEEDRSMITDRIQVLKQGFLNHGTDIDLSDYFLLKRLLMNDFESIGQYRKNLCMVSYVDGEEYIINMVKLLEYFNHLKTITNGLNTIQITS